MSVFIKIKTEMHEIGGTNRHMLLTKVIELSHTYSDPQEGKAAVDKANMYLNGASGLQVVIPEERCKRCDARDKQQKDIPPIHSGSDDSQRVCFANSRRGLESNGEAVQSLDERVC